MTNRLGHDNEFLSVFADKPAATVVDVWAQYDEAGAMIGLVHVRRGEVEVIEDVEGPKMNGTDLPNGCKARRAVLFGTYSQDYQPLTTSPAKT